MLAMHKIKTNSEYQTNVRACIKAPNLLLFVNVEIIFSSMVVNLSCIDWTLSNCVNVLKPDISLMVVYRLAFVLLFVSFTESWYSGRSDIRNSMWCA